MQSQLANRFLKTSLIKYPKSHVFLTVLPALYIMIVRHLSSATPPLRNTSSLFFKLPLHSNGLCAEARRSRLLFCSSYIPMRSNKHILFGQTLAVQSIQSLALPEINTPILPLSQKGNVHEPAQFAATSITHSNFDQQCPAILQYQNCPSISRSYHHAHLSWSKRRAISHR